MIFKRTLHTLLLATASLGLTACDTDAMIRDIFGSDGPLGFLGLIQEEPAEQHAGQDSTEAKPAEEADYPSVIIGTQKWTKANMNVETDGSYCYDDDPDNCAKYGRLYTWPAASKVCGTGWRLPTKEDFQQLKTFLGKDGGLKMKSANFWKHGKNGTNFSGFDARPAGSRDHYGEYAEIGELTYFWSSETVKTADGSNNAFRWFLHYRDSEVHRGNDKVGTALSVRCIYEKPVTPEKLSTATTEDDSAAERNSVRDPLDEEPED